MVLHDLLRPIFRHALNEQESVGMLKVTKWFTLSFWFSVATTAMAGDSGVPRANVGGRFASLENGRVQVRFDLRPGEAWMLSVHEIEPNPQFLSTNRHIMQGYVDLARCPRWDGKRRELSGASRVVGGETYKVVLTLHGFRPKKVSAGGRIEMLEGGQRATLCLDRPQNATVNWTVSFDR